MIKGEIFWATNKRDNPHPIVFLEWIDSSRFKACILSTKSTSDNILMNENHFYESDANGNPYSIKYNNTYLIPEDSFIKMTFWLTSGNAKGRLTQEGIEFIEEQITKEPVLCSAPIWEYKSSSQ